MEKKTETPSVLCIGVICRDNGKSLSHSPNHGMQKLLGWPTGTHNKIKRDPSKTSLIAGDSGAEESMDTTSFLGFISRNCLLFFP